MFQPYKGFLGTGQPSYGYPSYQNPPYPEIKIHVAQPILSTYDTL